MIFATLSRQQRVVRLRVAMSACALRRVAKAMVAMRADVEGGAVQDSRNGTEDLESVDGAKRGTRVSKC